MKKQQLTFIGQIRHAVKNTIRFVRRPGAWQLGLIAAAVLAVLFIPSPQKEQPTEPAPVFDPVKVVNASTELPDESPIKREDFAWTGVPEEPKTIRFPSINSEGFVQKVTIDETDHLSVPTNVNLAGWYVNSAIPGQPGISIFVGHVDGKTSPGIFKRLPDLKQDDILEIELGNGTVLTYKVFKVQTVDIASAENILFSQDPAIESQLNMITCSGTVAQGSTLQGTEVIASAELIE